VGLFDFLKGKNKSEKFYNQGVALQKLCRYADAVASFDQAIEIDMANSHAWHSRGLALGELGLHADAIKSVDKAITLCPDEHLYEKSRKELIAKKTNANKENQLKVRVKRKKSKAQSPPPNNHPSRYETFFDKGNMYLNLGQYTDAVESYDKALEIKPKDFHIWFFRSIALNNLGQYSDAINSVDEAIELCPNEYIYLKFRADLVIKEEERTKNEKARIEDEINSKAKEIISEAIQLFSKGQFVFAIEMVDKALAIQPDNTEYIRLRDQLVTDDPKPDLTISLHSNSLRISSWQGLNVILTNSGNGDAQIVTITLSDDFETRRVGIHIVKAGTSETIEIPVRPKHDGHVPLDITLTYKDSQDRTYEAAGEFWVDVGEQSSSGFTSTSPSSTPSPDSSNLFTKYQSHDLIGEGGFALVYRASRDGRTYAVKVPKTPDSATGKTFISEIQNWTRLSHPNIVKVSDYNILPTPYFEMEYCEASLDSLPKPMSPDQAAWLIYGVCSGLHYAHGQKIIHRDLKPQNILIKEGIPKITDWGLSKVMTESKSTTSTSFTPYYAAPEQMGSQPKDERTDIWQLGAILYELVTGTVPFTGESMMEVMMGIMSRDPVKPTDLNPDVKEIEPVILRCLEKDPAKRFGSVPELQRVLAFYLKVTYTEALRVSQGSDDRKSAYLCGELLLIHLDSGELPQAVVYGKDLIRYLSGENRTGMESLVEQMSFCVDEGLTDLPEELMRKAEWIVHGSRLEGMR